MEMITEAWTDADEAATDDEQSAGFFVEETELTSPSGGVTKVRTTAHPQTHTRHTTRTCSGGLAITRAACSWLVGWW